VWDAALTLVAEHGLAVLPLRAGEKVPATEHGVKDASTSLEQLEQWALRWPDANLGVAGGGMSRLVVLDFDTPEAIDALTARYGARPPTWTATTPRGGRHEFFTYPGPVSLGNTVAKLAPHVDTRGVHGYVVAAPSALRDGRGYAWVPGRSPADLERAALPVALLEALTARPAVEQPSSHASLPAEATPERRVGRYLAALPPLADGMGRNLTAFRLAAFVLHDVRGTADDARIALEAWNARNLEPLDHAALTRALRNALRYGGRRAA